MHGGIEMIKKILTVLFCGLITMSGHCNTDKYLYVTLDGTKMASIIDAHDDAKGHKEAILSKYRDVLKGNGGVGITSKQMAELCKGIKFKDKKNGCLDFGKSLLNQAGSGSYYAACATSKYPDGVSAKCIKVFDDVTVAKNTADALVKDYDKLQLTDDELGCTNYRDGKYKMCRSQNTKKQYYEFKFSSTNASNDRKLDNGVKRGICALFGLDYQKSRVLTVYKDGGQVPETFPAYCKTTDSKLCANINAVAGSYGLASKYGGSSFHGCSLEEIVDSKRSLVNEIGNKIDPFKFSDQQAQIEIKADNDTMSAANIIQGYVETQLGKNNVKKFKCNNAPTKLWIGDAKEDVLTCYINDKRVDFVFDDLSQSTAGTGKKKIEGSKQALECIIAGGEFTGKQCMLLNEKQCANLAAVSAKNCPDCKSIYWDKDDKICVLPSAKQASVIKSIESNALKVGGAVIVVTTTVISGGSALAVVGTTAVAAGVTMDVGAQVSISNQADKYIKELNQCATSSCAESFLRKNLQKISNLRVDFTAPQRSAIDTAVAKLVNLLPDDSDLLAEFVMACGKDADGHPVGECPFNKNGSTPAQIIKIVGEVLQIAGSTLLIVDSIIQLTKTAAAIQTRIDKLKTNGWIRHTNSNGEVGWLNQTTGKFQTRLPNGKVGWDPGVRRFRAFNGRFATNQYVSSVVGSAVRGAAVANIVGAGTNIAGNLLDDQNVDDVVPDLEREKPEKKDPVISDPVISDPVISDPNVPVPMASDSYIDLPKVKLPTPLVDAPSRDRPSVMNTTVDVSSGGQRAITPYDAKKPMNTGLIATAAVLGAVGTGALIGGLVSNDKDDNKNTKTGTQLEKDLEGLMNNADRSLGFVNGSMIKLVPMATTNNTTAKIVNINGSAVVVVDYRGHNLPYYVNGQTGSWVPLLGIGQTGGWFNTYLSNTPPSVVTQIQGILGQQLKPSTVVKFVGSNSLGVQFPYAAPDAYKVINAEFPNGVVETFNGVFSPSDQALYNNNYQRILNLFNTAAHLGGFFYCKKLISV